MMGYCRGRRLWAPSRDRHSSRRATTRVAPTIFPNSAHAPYGIMLKHAEEILSYHRRVVYCRFRRILLFSSKSAAGYSSYLAALLFRVCILLDVSRVHLHSSTKLPGAEDLPGGWVRQAFPRRRDCWHCRNYPSDRFSSPKSAPKKGVCSV